MELRPERISAGAPERIPERTDVPRRRALGNPKAGSHAVSSPQISRRSGNGNKVDNVPNRMKTQRSEKTSATLGRHREVLVDLCRLGEHARWYRRPT